MKIIGKTSGGYLVEATEDELARCCGFSYSSSSDWQAHTAMARDNGYGRSNDLKSGAEIQINAAHNYLGKLRDNERSLLQSASVLRGLADMIENGVPTVIVPPKPEST